MKPVIEICCGSADDVIEAQRAGADRVELNSAMTLGGLTPSLGELITAKRYADIPVMAMIRPREGGFCYSSAEYEAAVEDARSLADAGADGLVFGFLHEDGTLDEARTAALVKIALDAGIDAVFHRAIDVVPDWRKTFDALAAMKITRVLTSGQDACALDGADTIAAMREYAAQRLEVMAGGGIRLGNIKEVQRVTGCMALHMSAHKYCMDTSAAGNSKVRFGSAPSADETQYRRVDGEYVSRIMHIE